MTDYLSNFSKYSSSLSTSLQDALSNDNHIQSQFEDRITSTYNELQQAIGELWVAM